jgi:hypothetical protein
MAALSIADRTRIWRGLMRRWSHPDSRQTCAFTKFDLYNPTANTGAIADTDNWIDTHGGNTAPDTVGFNGALTVAMRAALTLAMKTEMFVAVAAMRVSPEFARRLLGEVD